MKKIFYLLMLFFSVLNAHGAEDLEILIDKGNDAFKKMEYEKAAKIYDQGIKNTPHEAVLYYNLANTMHRTKKYEKAIDLYDKAISYNPKKILLKNIYFNAGNASFMLFKEKSEKTLTVENLQEVLAGYEKVIRLYRKAIDLDTQISITYGKNIKKAGKYAKHNLAIARVEWTKTLEKIGEIEKKNLKIEDGVKNLLYLQTDFINRLENVYLNSLTNDTLKFNLKILAEYQLDYRDKIDDLRKLALKDVKNINGKIESSKAAKQNKKQSAPLLKDDNTKEYANLLKKKEGIIKVQQALNHAAEIEEWIVDGLKLKNPVSAWKKLRLMISLLQDLDTYFKKNDPIKQNYTDILKELLLIESLFQGLSQPNIKAYKNSFKKFKYRILNLSVLKLDMISESFTDLHDRLKAFKDESVKKIMSDQKSFLNKKGEKKSQQSDKKQKPVSDENVILDKLNEIFITINKLSFDEIFKRNDNIKRKINKKSKILKKIKDNDLYDNKSLAKIFKGEDLISKCKDVFIQYENVNKSLIELFAVLIEKSEETLVWIDLPENKKMVEDGFDYLEAFPVMEVLFFKYRLFIDEVKKSKELFFLKKRALASHKSLTDTWENVSKISGTKLSSKNDVEKHADNLLHLQKKLIDNMSIFAPDIAIKMVYEQIKSFHKIISDKLSQVEDNYLKIVKKYNTLKVKMQWQRQLIDDYFSLIDHLIKIEVDKNKKDELVKKNSRRKKSLDLIKYGIATGDDAEKLLVEKKIFLGSFLLKDLAQTIEKSQLSFLNQPQNAKKGLEFAIKYQTALKTQTKKSEQIQNSEKDIKLLISCLSYNQSYIIDLANYSTAKIREMIENSSKNKIQNKPGQQKGVQLQSPPPQQIDVKTLEKAIKIVQEGLVEADKIFSFIKAEELNNIVDKHDTVIALFKKALDLLLNKGDDKKGDDKKTEKNPSDNGQKDNQDKKKGGENNSGNQSNKSKREPLNLSPEQARELLNQLNKEDEKKTAGKKVINKVINVPRPW